MLRWPRFDGGETMRSMTICLLVTLCSMIAVGQDEPQWKVIKHVTLTQQSDPIPSTVLVTPTEPGVYRLSMYLSTGSRTAQGQVFATLYGYDITGGPLTSQLDVYCRGQNWL